MDGVSSDGDQDIATSAAAADSSNSMMQSHVDRELTLPRPEAMKHVDLVELVEMDQQMDYPNAIDQLPRPQQMRFVQCLGQMDWASLMSLDEEATRKMRRTLIKGGISCAKEWMRELRSMYGQLKKFIRKATLPEGWQDGQTLGAISHHLNRRKVKTASTEQNDRHFGWWTRYFRVIKRYRLMVAVYKDMVGEGILDQHEDDSGDEKKDGDGEQSDDGADDGQQSVPQPQVSPPNSQPSMSLFAALDDPVDEEKEQARQSREDAEELKRSMDRHQLMAQQDKDFVKLQQQETDRALAEQQQRREKENQLRSHQDREMAMKLQNELTSVKPTPKGPLQPPPPKPQKTVRKVASLAIQRRRHSAFQIEERKEDSSQESTEEEWDNRDPPVHPPCDDQPMPTDFDELRRRGPTFRTRSRMNVAYYADDEVPSQVLAIEYRAGLYNQQQPRRRDDYYIERRSLYDAKPLQAIAGPRDDVQPLPVLKRTPDTGPLPFTKEYGKLKMVPGTSVGGSSPWHIRDGAAERFQPNDSVDSVIVTLFAATDAITRDVEVNVAASQNGYFLAANNLFRTDGMFKMGVEINVNESNNWCCICAAPGISIKECREFGMYAIHPKKGRGALYVAKCQCRRSHVHLGCIFGSHFVPRPDNDTGYYRFRCIFCGQYFEFLPAKLTDAKYLAQGYAESTHCFAMRAVLEQRKSWRVSGVSPSQDRKAIERIDDPRLPAYTEPASDWHDEEMLHLLDEMMLELLQMPQMKEEFVSMKIFARTEHMSVLWYALINRVPRWAIDDSVNATAEVAKELKTLINMLRNTADHNLRHLSALDYCMAAQLESRHNELSSMEVTVNDIANNRNAPLLWALADRARREIGADTNYHLDTEWIDVRLDRRGEVTSLRFLCSLGVRYLDPDYHKLCSTRNMLYRAQQQRFSGLSDETLTELYYDTHPVARQGLRRHLNTLNRRPRSKMSLDPHALPPPHEVSKENYPRMRWKGNDPRYNSEPHRKEVMGICKWREFAYTVNGVMMGRTVNKRTKQLTSFGRSWHGWRRVTLSSQTDSTQCINFCMMYYPSYIWYVTNPNSPISEHALFQASPRMCCFPLTAYLGFEMVEEWKICWRCGYDNRPTFPTCRQCHLPLQGEPTVFRSGSEKALAQWRKEKGGDAVRGMPTNLRRRDAHPHPYNPRMVSDEWEVHDYEPDHPLRHQRRVNQDVQAPVNEDGVFRDNVYE